MEEVMKVKKPSPSDELSGFKDEPSSAFRYSAPRTRDEDGISFTKFFERLSQVPANQVHPQVRRDLSTAEFLELLKKQVPGGHSPPTAGFSFQGSLSKSQSMHNTDKNQFYQSTSIDQCDITSSVDYGSRDYYRPSTSTSETPYVYKEKELDGLYKTSTDTRGDWWEGSLYY